MNKILIVIACFGFLLLSFCTLKDDDPADEGSFLTLDTNSTFEKTDVLLANGFDFPVGNVDGKGSYISLVDKKSMIHGTLLLQQVIKINLAFIQVKIGPVVVAAIRTSDNLYTL